MKYQVSNISETWVPAQIVSLGGVHCVKFCAITFLGGVFQKSRSRIYYVTRVLICLLSDLLININSIKSKSFCLPWWCLNIQYLPRIHNNQLYQSLSIKHLTNNSEVAIKIEIQKIIYYQVGISFFHLGPEAAPSVFTWMDSFTRSQHM